MKLGRRVGGSCCLCSQAVGGYIGVVTSDERRQETGTDYTIE